MTAIIHETGDHISPIKLYLTNYLNGFFWNFFQGVIKESVVFLRHELLRRVHQHLEGIDLVLVQHPRVGERLLGLDDAPEDVLNEGLGVDGLLVHGLVSAAFGLRFCGCGHASYGRNPDSRVGRDQNGTADSLHHLEVM